MLCSSTQQLPVAKAGVPHLDNPAGSRPRGNSAPHGHTGNGPAHSMLALWAAPKASQQLEPAALSLGLGACSCGDSAVSVSMLGTKAEDSVWSDRPCGNNYEPYAGSPATGNVEVMFPVHVLYCMGSIWLLRDTLGTVMMHASCMLNWGTCLRRHFHCLGSATRCASCVFPVMGLLYR
jgi:hypothetical protein